MRPRFQGDENFSGPVIDGLLRKNPRIDFRTSHSMQLAGLLDDKVLQRSAADNRILVTHDLRTMPVHFGVFITNSNSPGVIVIPRSMSISASVEELFMIWAASEHEEYFNRIVTLPF